MNNNSILLNKGFPDLFFYSDYYDGLVCSFPETMVIFKDNIIAYEHYKKDGLVSYKKISTKVIVSTNRTEKNELITLDGVKIISELENIRIWSSEGRLFFGKNLSNNKSFMFDSATFERNYEIPNNIFQFSNRNGNVYSTLNPPFSFTLIDNSHGNILWNYSLSSKFNFTRKSIHGGNILEKRQVERLIGIHKGIVWISIDSGHLIGIDYETGNENT